MWLRFQKCSPQLNKSLRVLGASREASLLVASHLGAEQAFEARSILDDER